MLVVRTAPVPIHFAIHSSPALGKYALIIAQQGRYTRSEMGLVAFTVLGVDDNSSKMPLLLVYSNWGERGRGKTT